jgi:hypothetical protein
MLSTIACSASSSSLFPVSLACSLILWWTPYHGTPDISIDYLVGSSMCRVEVVKAGMSYDVLAFSPLPLFPGLFDKQQTLSHQELLLLVLSGSTRETALVSEMEGREKEMLKMRRPLTQG